MDAGTGADTNEAKNVELHIQLNMSAESSNLQPSEKTQPPNPPPIKPFQVVSQGDATSLHHLLPLTPHGLLMGIRCQKSPERSSKPTERSLTFTGC